MKKIQKNVVFLLILSTSLSSCANQYLDYSDLSHAQKLSYYKQNQVILEDGEYVINDEIWDLNDVESHYKEHGAHSTAASVGLHEGWMTTTAVGVPLVLGVGWFASILNGLGNSSANIERNLISTGVVAGSLLVGGLTMAWSEKNEDHHLEFNSFLWECLMWESEDEDENE